MSQFTTYTYTCFSKKCASLPFLRSIIVKPTITSSLGSASKCPCVWKSFPSLYVTCMRMCAYLCHVQSTCVGMSGLKKGAGHYSLRILTLFWKSEPLEEWQKPRLTVGFGKVYIFSRPAYSIQHTGGGFLLPVVYTCSQNNFVWISFSLWMKLYSYILLQQYKWNSKRNLGKTGLKTMPYHSSVCSIIPARQNGVFGWNFTYFPPIFRLWYHICFSALMFMEFAYFCLFPFLFHIFSA